MDSITSQGRSELQCPQGKIALLGMVRVNDMGVHELEVQLQSCSPMFGEWAPKFEANGNDINVEIVSFGYRDKYNVRNQHPNTRNYFTSQDELVIRNLIRAVFDDDQIRTSVPPFTSNKAKFLGDVTYRPGWINIR